MRKTMPPVFFGHGTPPEEKVAMSNTVIQTLKNGPYLVNSNMEKIVYRANGNFFDPSFGLIRNPTTGRTAGKWGVHHDDIHSQW